MNVPVLSSSFVCEFFLWQATSLRIECITCKGESLDMMSCHGHPVDSQSQKESLSDFECEDAFLLDSISHCLKS